MNDMVETAGHRMVASSKLIYRSSIILFVITGLVTASRIYPICSSLFSEPGKPEFCCDLA